MASRSLVVALGVLGAGLTASAPVALFGASFGPSSALTNLRAWSGMSDVHGNGLGATDLLDFRSSDDVSPHAPDSPVAAQVQPDWVNARAPGQTCLTHQRYLANLQEQGINPLTVVCAPDGPCDNPIERDAAIPDANTPVKTYRLSIHVFCENNGGNCAATQADVDTAVARLNADFAPWRIQFVYQMNFVNSTRYRYLDVSTTEPSYMKSAHADSPVTKLNVYVVDVVDSAASWGVYPWDPDALGAQGGVVTDEFVFVAASPLPHILTHEVGHCLGLHHTHHGVSDVPPCADCYEPAGRSAEDGDVTGDRCSDTQPTPNTNRDCFDPPGTDPCSGNPWVNTPYLNYMGYSYLCQSEFTPQQAGRMHCWTEDRLTGWLQLPMPPAAPGTPALTKLTGGIVRIAWADNSNNEEGFRVQRETKSGGSWINPQIVATVGANMASATNAPGPGTFRYRVQAFNTIGDSAWSGWKQINN